MEQHFYPSSLAFNVVCLLEKAVVHATHLGLQRKVLLEMRSQGRDSIVDPRGLYDLCRVAGLVEQNAVDESETDLKLQRCAILTVALEHHFLDFLKSCLLHWHDGENFYFITILVQFYIYVILFLFFPPHRKI